MLATAFALLLACFCRRRRRRLAFQAQIPAHESAVYASQRVVVMIRQNQTSHGFDDSAPSAHDEPVSLADLLACSDEELLSGAEEAGPPAAERRAREQRERGISIKKRKRGRKPRSDRC